jgi:hypothetical protein
MVTTMSLATAPGANTTVALPSALVAVPPLVAEITVTLGGPRASFDAVALGGLASLPAGSVLVDGGTGGAVVDVASVPPPPPEEAGALVVGSPASEVPSGASVALGPDADDGVPVVVSCAGGSGGVETAGAGTSSTDVVVTVCVIAVVTDVGTTSEAGAGSGAGTAATTGALPRVTVAGGVVATATGEGAEIVGVGSTAGAGAVVSGTAVASGTELASGTVGAAVSDAGTIAGALSPAPGSGSASP